MARVRGEGAIITPEDIHYYDLKPMGAAAMKGHGIDLAISLKRRCGLHYHRVGRSSLSGR
jgi:hypothetical protein